MAQQSQEETIRTEKSQKEEAEERCGTEEFIILLKEQYVLRVKCRGRRPARQSQPTAICPDKDTDSSSERGELVYHQPSPSSGETHLASRWTFIRPDSHQMVSGFGPEPRGPALGEAAASQLSWGAQIGAFLSARCQARRRELATNAGARLPLRWYFVTRNFWKGKSKIPEPFKFVFKPFLLLKNKMEGGKKEFRKLQAKMKCQ